MLTNHSDQSRTGKDGRARHAGPRGGRRPPEMRVWPLQVKLEEPALQVRSKREAARQLHRFTAAGALRCPGPGDRLERHLPGTARDPAEPRRYNLAPAVPV